MIGSNIYTLDNGESIIADTMEKVKEIDKVHENVVSITINSSTVSTMQFFNLPNLKEILVNNSSEIKAYGFGNCPKLEQITVKDDCILTIEYNAFLGCTSLKRIIGKPTNIEIK